MTWLAAFHRRCLLVALMLGAISMTVVHAQATPVPSGEGGQLTPLLDSVLSPPRWFSGSDGQVLLVFELALTNAIPAPVTVREVEVRDAESGSSLIRLNGEALLVAMSLATSPDSPAVVLPPSSVGIVWLAVNGCCSPESGLRSARIAVDGDRVVKTEMFAIDLIRLIDGRLFAGDGASREQWFGYGADVLAVADGTVVAVRDGMPEETPNEPLRYVEEPGDAGGNHVLLELAPGVYAFYAHLQPGSIAVAEGDRVAAGDVLGLLGNTGQSTAPHLLFVLIDTADPFTGSSLPMVFDRYTLAGEVTPAAFAAAATGRGGLIPEGAPRQETATLPVGNNVVDFP